MKKCIKCDEIKGVNDFYNHPQTKDGKLNKCKDCCKKESNDNLKLKMNDPQFVIKEKARHLEKDRRLYRKTTKPLREALPKIHKESWRNHFEKYPEKYYARQQTSKIKASIKGNQLHHWSYSKENSVNVIELNVKQHQLVHKNLIYVQSEMCYENLNNELLNTKEKHLIFLKSIGITI